VKPKADLHHSRDPRRSGHRSLGAAEGVLVALRHCSLDEAFIDIVHTAKRHNVAPLRLATLEHISRRFGTRVDRDVDTTSPSMRRDQDFDRGGQPGSDLKTGRFNSWRDPEFCCRVDAGAMQRGHWLV
jgi:hypothetical protein